MSCALRGRASDQATLKGCEVQRPMLGIVR